MTIYEPIDYRHAIAISHKTSHGQYFEFCFRLFLFANVLPFSFGTSGRQAGSIKQVYRVPDYLANFSVNSYLQMFCLFHLAQGWHQAGVQRAAIIWQIFFWQLSFSNVLSVQCWHQADVRRAAIIWQSDTRHPILHLFPCQNILLIISYTLSLTTAKQCGFKIYNDIMGGESQHPDVQNTTFAIQLLFSDQT